jgi:hypothetical protein
MIEVIGPAELSLTLQVAQGPSGPVGPAGVGATQVFPSPNALGGGRFVISTSGGNLDYAFASNVTHAGFVVGITTAANAINTTSIVQSFGLFEEPSWGWITNQPLFLADNGLMTQTPASQDLGGFNQAVGFAISPTKIWIDLQDPIIFVDANPN